MNLWEALGVVLLVAVVLWLVDTWLYRRMQRSKSYSGRGAASGLGNALLRVQALVDPAAAHAVEVSEEETSEEDPSGDPPS
ncbi:MAG: hypothetical protein K8J08_13735 [Thermoanaerobaculia bacterium]|nr:hypothetical protein [Thermoanaerobaculia bacterium]